MRRLPHWNGGPSSSSLINWGSCERLYFTEAYLSVESSPLPSSWRATSSSGSGTPPGFFPFRRLSFNLNKVKKHGGFIDDEKFVFNRLAHHTRKATRKIDTYPPNRFAYSVSGPFCCCFFSRARKKIKNWKSFPIQSDGDCSCGRVIARPPPLH